MFLKISGEFFVSMNLYVDLNLYKYLSLNFKFRAFYHNKLYINFLLKRKQKLH